MERFYSVKPLDSPSNGDNALFTARYVDSDIKVVIKKCDKELSQTQTEEEITQILKHPNIITCYEVFEIDDYVFSVHPDLVEGTDGNKHNDTKFVALANGEVNFVNKSITIF